MTDQGRERNSNFHQQLPELSAGELEINEVFVMSDEAISAFTDAIELLLERAVGRILDAEDTLQPGTAPYGRRGATKEIIEAYTVVHKYKKAQSCDGQEEEDQCTVCVSSLQDEEVARRLPCTHLFHLECIDEWLTRTKTCPVCRREIDAESHDFSTENVDMVPENLDAGSHDLRSENVDAESHDFSTENVHERSYDFSRENVDTESYDFSRENVSAETHDLSTENADIGPENNEVIHEQDII